MFMRCVNTDFGSDFILKDTITEDDVQGFIDSFTFPDIDQWCIDQYESDRDSFEDSKYEEEKDRRMGI